MKLICILFLIILRSFFQILFLTNTLLSVLLFLEIINISLICLILIWVKIFFVFQVLPIIIFLLRISTIEAFTFFFVISYDHLQKNE
jgi:hypothetical protein